MNRPDKTAYYLNIADTVSQRSTCLRRQYGAVIVKDDEIIATGYNGAPRGEPNCSDNGYCWREAHNIPHGEQYEKCVSGDSVIKCLNGTYKTIKQLSEENEDVWVYSIDILSGRIVPAKATNIRKTGSSKRMCIITFDNNKCIKCTPDHKILMRNCEYINACDLKIGDSVMPMYYTFNCNKRYEEVYNTIQMRKGRMPNGSVCNTNSTPTHILVSSFFNKNHTKLHDEIVHHKNGNWLDNTPENLEFISRGEHSSLHYTEDRKRQFLINTKRGALGQMKLKKIYGENQEYREKKSRVGKENMTKNWADEEFVKRSMIRMSENGRKTTSKINKDPKYRAMMERGKVLAGLSRLRFLMKENNDDSTLNGDTYINIRDKYKCNGRRGGNMIPKLERILKSFPSIDDAIEQSATYNHKVTSVEIVESEEDVYCMEVPDYNNFAIELGDNSCVFVHNCVSVHAEANAIISAKRSDMIGATIYLSGRENGKLLEDPRPCEICRRLIKNAGLIFYKSEERSETINANDN